MKNIFLILIILLFQTGCVSVKYKPYSSSETYVGTGGSIENINGVDFWDNGTPNYEYKIIGVIEWKANDAPIQNSMMKKKIAKKAKKYGADAVIFFDESIKQTGSTTNIGPGFGNTLNANTINVTKKKSKFYAIQYIK